LSEREGDAVNGFVPKNLQFPSKGADNRGEVTSERTRAPFPSWFPNPTEATMTYIQGPIPPSGPEAARSKPEISRAGAERLRKTHRTEQGDVISISEIARLKAKLASIPEVRHELIERIRAEIEAGTYDTIEKVQKAAERLLEELKEEGFFS